MKVFAISLRAAHERRKSLHSEMRRCGMGFTIIDAVDGKELDEAQIESMCDMDAVRQHPTWLTRGAIGCTLSHVEVYRRIIQEDLPYALILEDDVALCENLKEHLSKIESVIGVDEVVMLYYQSWEPLQLNVDSRKDYGDAVSSLYVPYKIEQVTTTGAYIVTRKAAERLMEQVFPIRVSIDSWGYFHSNGLVKRLSCVYPRVVSVKPFKSSIDYIKSRQLSYILKIVNRTRLPIVYQLLRSRRVSNMERRTRVVLK